MYLIVALNIRGRENVRGVCVCDVCVGKRVRPLTRLPVQANHLCGFR